MALEPIKLLGVDIKGEYSLGEAYFNRHSTRVFSDKPIALQDLTNLLWAAYGTNRMNGYLTVPSAYGIFPLEFYAVMEKGVYHFNRFEWSLDPVIEGDYRTLTGHQDFLSVAPLTLLIFSDREKMILEDPRHNQNLHDNLERVEALDAGACTQNIYLYCGCVGLNAVERLLCDGERFKKVCGLKDSLHYVVAMTIGYTPDGAW